MAKRELSEQQMKICNHLLDDIHTELPNCRSFVKNLVMHSDLSKIFALSSLKDRERESEWKVPVIFACLLFKANIKQKNEVKDLFNLIEVIEKQMCERSLCIFLDKLIDEKLTDSYNDLYLTILLQYFFKRQDDSHGSEDAILIVDCKKQFANLFIPNCPSKNEFKNDAKIDPSALVKICGKFMEQPDCPISVFLNFLSCMCLLGTNSVSYEKGTISSYSKLIYDYILKEKNNCYNLGNEVLEMHLSKNGLPSVLSQEHPFSVVVDALARAQDISQFEDALRVSTVVHEDTFSKINLPHNCGFCDRRENTKVLTREFSDFWDTFTEGNSFAGAGKYQKTVVTRKNYPFSNGPEFVSIICYENKGYATSVTGKRETIHMVKEKESHYEIPTKPFVAEIIDMDMRIFGRSFQPNKDQHSEDSPNKLNDKRRAWLIPYYLKLYECVGLKLSTEWDLSTNAYLDPKTRSLSFGCRSFPVKFVADALKTFAVSETFLQRMLVSIENPANHEELITDLKEKYELPLIHVWSIDKHKDSIFRKSKETKEVKFASVNMYATISNDEKRIAVLTISKFTVSLNIGRETRTNVFPALKIAFKEAHDLSLYYELDSDKIGNLKENVKELRTV